MKDKIGRNLITIDWNVVDDHLEAGCLGTEIAAIFGMHPNTFYDRVLKEKNLSFTDYSSQKKSKGDSVIRKKQFEKAKKGDNTMLIWLGKIRLDQREIDHQAIPLHADSIDKENECMILRAKLAKAEQEIEQLKGNPIENQSETRSELSGVNTQI